MKYEQKADSLSGQPVDSPQFTMAEDEAESGAEIGTVAGATALNTPAERASAGKAARINAPRAGQAAWNPADDRPDPIDLLEAQAASRIPELIPIRYGRMLTSPHAFYRGAAAIMACDLAANPQSGLRVQLCGDAHLANFGGFASPERDIVFDINDFDETLPGPFEWDVKRLAASIEVAGREQSFTASQRRLIVLAAVGEYRRAMLAFAEMGNLEVWYTLLDAAKVQALWGATSRLKGMKAIETSLSQAHTRDNQRAFERLTERVGEQVRIVSHPPLIVPVEELYPETSHRLQAEETFQNYVRAYGETLPDDRRHLLEQFHYVHMARKVVGVSSVGMRTWIILLVGRDDQDPLFLQVKQAEASVLEPYAGKSQITSHGRRVVEGQRLMQSASDIFLGWERVPDMLDDRPHDYYVRQLWDWKLSFEVESMPPEEMTIYGEMCGWTLAHAHARSGDRIAIAAYMGRGASFDQALAEFAVAYADQNERDYQALTRAVKSGRLQAQKGV